MPNLNVTCSRHKDFGLKITTYRDNKPILVGLLPDESLSVQQRLLQRTTVSWSVAGGSSEQRVNHIHGHDRSMLVSRARVNDGTFEQERQSGGLGA